jgi:hypothetical protein
MRVSIDLPSNLVSELEARAAREERTLSEIVTDAARAFAARQASPVDLATHPSLPISKHVDPGVMPGIDLLNSAELLELIEADRPLDRRR